MIRFRFVGDNQTDLSVKRICELVEVPRSSFDAWASHVLSARDVTDATLVDVIRDVPSVAFPPGFGPIG